VTNTLAYCNTKVIVVVNFPTKQDPQQRSKCSFTVLKFKSSHHGNVDAVGGSDGDEGDETADEWGQRLDHGVQAQRSDEGTAGGSDVRSTWKKLAGKEYSRAAMDARSFIPDKRKDFG
jgi:hypothetical protein